MKVKIDILEWIRSTGRDPMYVSIEALRLLQEFADQFCSPHPAVSEDAQQRYEKAMESFHPKITDPYNVGLIPVHNRIDVKEAIRIAAGLKEGDKP